MTRIWRKLLLVPFAISLMLLPLKSASTTTLDKSADASFVYHFNGTQDAKGNSSIDVDIEMISAQWPELYNLLWPTGIIGTELPEGYSCKWSLCPGITEDAAHIFYQFSRSARFCGFGTAKEDETHLTDKDIFKVEILKDGQPLTYVICHMDKLLHIPTWDIREPKKEYVYYTPGLPVTINIDPVPSIGGNTQMYYFWMYDRIVDGGSVFADNLTAPTVTFIPPSGADGYRVTYGVSVAEIPGTSWKGMTEYILVDQTIHGMPSDPDTITVPTVESKILHYSIEKNNSVALSLPAASGVSTKTLVYNWYSSTDGVKFNFIKSTIIPETVISNTGKESGKVYYSCDVGYTDMLAEDFIPYNVTFIVDFGDNGGFAPADTIIVPAVENQAPYYTIGQNDSIALSLPAAIGDSNKKLVYNWYSSVDGVNFHYLKSTITPDTTISNTNKESGKVYYSCEVGYADMAYGDFVPYNVLFTVDFGGNSNADEGTTASVPRTGDETPLTALYVLLAAAAASVGVIARIRRRRSA